MHHSEILWITSVFRSSNLGFHIFCKKTGHFSALFRHFSELSHFLPLNEHLLTKKWSDIPNYIYISFKRSKNEVKRTFLVPSKNYHALTSAKINQVLEVCLILPSEPWIFAPGVKPPKMLPFQGENVKKLIAHPKVVQISFIRIAWTSLYFWQFLHP